MAVNSPEQSKQQKVVIIDTGCANLSSVKFAVERLGYNVTVTYDADTIKAADKVFLPGVGAAGAAMEIINERGLVEVVQSLTQPVLGICLGMQLMTAFSEEGQVDCLQLTDDKVAPLQANGLRLPHMGWNTLTEIADHPLFAGVNQDDYFYFVHSFCVNPSGTTLATCDYGQTFAASIGRDNFMGVQFHPERSGKSGAKIIKNFLEMNA
ncbi:imidazole glycerol phosphate synthase subunit HisH [Saccharobesus litoralis]|uniref:Imidazole glycerol phosphate synthase subunit HisH n=1 Tax=Saccharobesus litoralis TaxID=2172099 RepID=A0A2S0VTL4_9ALTE|nr:imidazole glycerol phosphate synthase subunit HisH [Saccharobesus litoralis]AWB67551.1 imidazole glycerol phosphate synthase subunit HisH [Saccharobesus litoralis]